MLKTVEVPGARLSVYDAGQGPPILFAHGFPLEHRMWTAQLESLAGTHRVIAPDLRGFGASTVTAGTVTMAQFADDCAALLDALDVREPVTFCGLSMGGYIALAFLRHHAARLAKLVLCDTRAPPDTAEAAETRHKMAEHVMQVGTSFISGAMLPKLFAEQTRSEQPQIVEQVKQMIVKSAPAGIAAAQRGMAARPDSRPLLATIRVPTLVVVGEHDAISPADEMRSMAEAIPGSEFVLVPEAGHMAPMERPALVNAALRAFVD